MHASEPPAGLEGPQPWHHRARLAGGSEWWPPRHGRAHRQQDPVTGDLPVLVGMIGVPEGPLSVTLGVDLGVLSIFFGVYLRKDFATMFIML
jgi:hypothetical protein